MAELLNGKFPQAIITHIIKNNTMFDFYHV